MASAGHRAVNVCLRPGREWTAAFLIGSIRLASGRSATGRTAQSLRPGSQVQASDRFGAHVHRDVFDRELLLVKESVVRMGVLVEAAIDSAVVALATRDIQRAAAVVAGDRAINEAHADLTTMIVTTIATQSPVATDLRFLIALSHIAYELERIGDHAAGVAKRTARVGPMASTVDSSLVTIGELAGGLLHGVLRALVDLDADEARSVAAGDDEIDRLYHAYFQRALERMRADSHWVDNGAHLLFAAKDLERIGDRATNIAEEVVLLSTGEVEDLNP
jgi:phosphate transport system protein